MQTHFPPLLLPLISTAYFWYLLSSDSKKFSQLFFFSLSKTLFVLHQNKHYNMKNGCNELGNYCYIHPRDVVVGVCPLCLNERLLILAASSSQGRCRSSSRSNNSSAFYKPHHQNDNYLKNHKSKNNNNNNKNNNKNKPPALGFHKIFDFSSLLHRLEFRPSKPDFSADDDVHDVSTSQEDSFISIKFEDNGVASWEKNNNNDNNNNNNNNNVSKVSLENCNVSWKKNIGKEQANYNKETKTVIEHGKPCASSLRWRKRIGHLFRVIKWKRSNNGTVCHVSSKVEGVKVRKGWIRTLTKKRTME